MDRECLPNVPPICELCYCPVDTENEPFEMTRNWPQSSGKAVYLHSACFKRARPMTDNK